MSVKYFLTGNSRTPIAYHQDWRVLDIGSGHHPHPRANVLADKYLLDDIERTGRAAKLLSGKPFVVGDACRLPFTNKAFDFIICSHVAEHVTDVAGFCSEMGRVGRSGYIETPSRFTEMLLHVAVHRWFVSNKRGKLVFRAAPDAHPLGWFGKLLFSIHFYDTAHLKGRDVFAFAYGCRRPYHYAFLFMRWLLTLLLLFTWPVMYTRLLWKDRFHYEICQ